MSQEILSITSDLEENTAAFLKNKFMPFVEQAEEFAARAKDIVVTSADQKDEMKKAREIRLALKVIRVEADKRRKALKEDSLRYGKAVQGIYNVIEYMISPIERHLQEQEDFVKIQQEKMLSALREERSAIANEYAGFIPSIDYSSLTEEAWGQLVSSAAIAKKQKEDAEEAQRKEAEAKAKADAEDRERVRLENERLRAEAEALKKEREAAEAAARAERERAEAELARAKAEAEAKAKTEREAAEVERKKQERELARVKAEKERIEREAREKEARENAEKAKAEAAPDREKLEKIARELESWVAPELRDEKCRAIAAEIKILFAKVAGHISKKLEEI